MSLESYRNEALGYEETPQAHREIVLPKIEQEKELDKVRKLISAIDFELMEDNPNIMNVRGSANQIIRIMKGFIK